MYEIDENFLIFFLAKSTANICDVNTEMLNSEKPIYLQTPNYPNEYGNNLECNCSMRSTNGSPVQIELLEFDIESSGEGLLVPNPPNQLIFNEDSFNKKTDSNVFKQNQCSKDYLSIGADEVQLCGTLSPFSNLVNVKSTLKNQVTSLRFSSDDALSRRGFWVKLKASKVKETDCPENFVLVDNVCLRVYNQMLNWYEAQKFCTGMGFSLAVVDNFELDKQLNKALFTENENEKKFWIGVKHLNQTSWFDSRNEVLELDPDEAKWWPWLVVDSTTYNLGSCVGKRKNYLFLDDCYKRMPFACQFKPIASSETINSKVQLKCGKNSDAFFRTTTTSTTTSTASNKFIPISTKSATKSLLDFFVPTVTDKSILASCKY